MALICQTEEGVLHELVAHELALWAYCGMDSMITSEVFREQDKLFNETTRKVYRLNMAQLGPAMQMMLRGTRVDVLERQNVLTETLSTHQLVDKHLQLLSNAVQDTGLNYRSRAQLITLFYENMGISPIYTRVKGEDKISMGRETLEKLRVYKRALPFVNHALALRDLDKQIMVLKSGVDADSRMRCSYNVGGTENGRWSSSKNVFGGGTNKQNINDQMRRIFIADKGRKLAYLDLEQAESRAVAYTSEDLAYISACESGDLHTYCARLIWPDLEWIGTLAEDRQVAETPYYRHFTHRDMSKRGGHASNYYATAWTIAKHLKLEQAPAEEFQRRYFNAFPGIRRWQRAVAEQLQRTARLTTAMGRERIFFGRRDDDATLREAIAYDPASTVADILNIGLYLVWYYMDLPDERVQILEQTHDAVLLQFWEDDLDAVDEAMRLMTLPVPIKGRVMTIPVGCEVGYSWRRARDGDPAVDMVSGHRSPEALAQRRPPHHDDPLEWKW